MGIPAYLRRFREAVLAGRVTQVDVPLKSGELVGSCGIRTTSHLQYNCERWQLLGREHEYSFALPDGHTLEVSLQLYQNVRDHWRLFAYCGRGLLLSANLSTVPDARSVVALAQTLRMTQKTWRRAQRAEATEQLAACLRSEGLDVDDNNRLVLGTFDSREGRFVDTSPKAFVRDFVIAAVLKGHFMGNKGYALPRLSVAARPASGHFARSTSRSIPLGLRFSVIERARGRCVACGRGPKQGRKLHVDHIIPWSRGGKTELRNLQALCDRCNIGKGNGSTLRFG